jgi:hypothetical protein
MFAAFAPRSLAAGFYLFFTHFHAEKICREFRQERGWKLYVLKDLEVPRIEKSQEQWNTAAGSNRADDLFCILGFARAQEPPTVYASPFFRQANPPGVVCFSQAMVYNANPQRRPRGAGGATQPQVGYDTLNWTNNVSEYPSHFLGNLNPFREAPRITLNWQAKLVPITQYKLGVMQFAPLGDAKISQVFKERLRPVRFYGKSLYTH